MHTFLARFLCSALIIGTAKGLKVSEAEQIALESSGKLLPPPDLVKIIEHDLAAIREKFSAVKDVGHTPKWEPGKLIISDVTPTQLDAINRSEYGPIESRAIFQDQIYLVTFTKPYHPERLAEILKKMFGVSGEPDSIIGGSSSITFSTDGKGKNTYVFMQGSGDCQAGCIDKHYWTFTVGPEEDCVELVGESGDPIEN